jgi:hypothetical protein
MSSNEKNNYAADGSKANGHLFICDDDDMEDDDSVLNSLSNEFDGIENGYKFDEFERFNDQKIESPRHRFGHSHSNGHGERREPTNDDVDGDNQSRQHDGLKVKELIEHTLKPVDKNAVNKAVVKQIDFGLEMQKKRPEFFRRVKPPSQQPNEDESNP